MPTPTTTTNQKTGRRSPYATHSSYESCQLSFWRVARDSPKISGSAAELPFWQWGGRFRCFSERPSFVRTSMALDRTALDWRVLTVWDSPHREQRLATTWEQLRRLCVRRDRGRQGELKSCTPPRGTGGPQAATMRLDDRATDGQPHTGSVNLGRKECPEGLVRLLRRQSPTGIADQDQQLTIAGFGLDDELASATRFLHSIDAVEHEVHENLLQLHTVRHDLWKTLSKLGMDRDRVAVRLAAQQDNHFSNEFIYINQLPLRRVLLEQRADSANDVRRARYIVNESRWGCACPCHVRFIATKPSQAGFGVRCCCRNRLLDLVRQRSGQLSHGSHPADVCEIRLRLTQSFFGTFAFGYVPRQFRCSNNAIRGILYRRNCQSNVEQAAVLAHADRLEVVDPLASRESLNNRSFFVAMIRGNNQRDVLANRLFRSVPEQAFCALIPTGDYAIQIFAHNRIVRRFHNGSQQTGRLLCSLAFGDVRRATHEFHQIPGCVQNRMTDSVDVFDNATWKKDSEFQLVMRLLSYRAIEYL